jgi:predicted nuclease of predicted toxin-antitoxin system
VALAPAPDRAIWAHARDHGFVIVSKDKDFPPAGVTVSESSCSEQRPVLSANAPRLNAQELEHPTELGKRRLLCSSHQRVSQGDQ